MQKVVGSSPIIRFAKSLATNRALVLFGVAIHASKLAKSAFGSDAQVVM